MKNFLLFACAVLSAGAACADDAAILQCRTLPAAAQRLACYDAIPVGAAPAAPPAGARPASNAPALPAAAPTAAAISAAAPAARPEQDFGLRPIAKKVQDEAPSAIRSKVAGRFDGWSPGSVFTLANGQVWKVTDDADAVLPVMQDPQVTITRGLLGSYFLQVEGHANRARVARVR